MADSTASPSTPVDVVLVGGGIMSATLGSIIRLVEPTWSIRIYERLDAVAQESSNAWNNAGTGHAALCELNYTPEKADGSIDITKAVAINEQFQTSREFWQHLVAADLLPEPEGFIASTPHMTFVRGAANVDYLRRRHAALVVHPLFSDLEFTDDPAVVGEWAPLLVAERSTEEPIAATRSTSGTDVNFGALTRKLTDYLESTGAELHLQHEITALRQRKDGTWRLKVADRSWNATERRSTVDAKFVFIGAGGGALPLLQKAGIPEAKGYGGFPISGLFLRTTNPELVAQHQAKVYGKADVGSPPMSVPHLDTRVVDGETSLLFGPYAGFSTKFLKKGSLLDLFLSIRPSNIVTMLAVAKDNMDLTKYLISEVTKSRWNKFKTLRDFMPTADPKDWEFITAGQRVQVMKSHPEKHGVLEFGTELITAADGTIAGLLGASPGASTAVPAMVDLLERCFPQQFPAWHRELATMMPSLAPQQWDSEEAFAELQADDADFQPSA